MWQQPILNGHNDHIEPDQQQQQHNQQQNFYQYNQGLGSSTNLSNSNSSLGSLTQMTQGGLSFSNSNPRSLNLNFANNSSGSLNQAATLSAGVGYTANEMSRSQSMGLPQIHDRGSFSRSASGRYHNETFRFPSITEETSTNMMNASFTSFTSGSMNSYDGSNSNGSNGRSHSNVVLGGMFANHLSLQNSNNTLHTNNGMMHTTNGFHGPNNGLAYRNSSDYSLKKPQHPEVAPPTPGPSELYRLISASSPDYKSILSRCRSHPHEACSFSLHAGCGHVYALHRLLRREDEEYQAPYEVVEEIRLACPRAVVRKQAVREEEDFMENRSRQVEDNAEDVRYEYPLSIAAEYGHSSEIVRMLAKATTTSPHYRAEVYRSLDYASLSNETVRILLEEYAGCVLERGYSEENEGDDDDCPLEKVLFWWDDPDVTGLEEEIATYPECDMKEDLDDLYEKLRMMLYATANQTMQDYDTSKQEFKVLHYLLRIAVDGGMNSVSFPNDFTHSVLLLAKFIQRTRAGMFRERDEVGSLPLHIAVTGKGLLKNYDGDSNKLEGDEQQQQQQQQLQETGSDEQQEAQEVNDDVEMGEAANQEGQADIPVPQEEQPLQNDGEDDELPEPDDDEEEDMGDIDEADMEEHENEASSSQSCGMEIIKLILEQYPASIRLYDTHTRSLPIHLVLKHNPHASEAIDHFLRLYPKSASMPDGAGRLPIHIALLHNSPSWEQILDLAPNTLEKKDPMTGLLPFQLAALIHSEKRLLTKTIGGPSSQPDTDTLVEQEEEIELESLGTCFQLLRMNPHLASGLAEAPTYSPADRHVARLEEENNMLRQRVYDLEQQVMQMHLSMQEANGNAIKKRKSFNAMDYFSRSGEGPS